MRKTCSRCKNEKDVDEFNKKQGPNRNPGTLSFYDSICRPCANQRQIEYRKRLSPEQRKEIDLKSVFGIDFKQWNYMFLKQEGCCAICKKHQSNFKRKLSVDHNHETGTIRGLLCMNCNIGIGKFMDSFELLENAISYLKINTESAGLNSDVGEVIPLKKEGYLY